MERDNVPAYRSFTRIYHLLFHITGILSFEDGDEPNATRRALKNGASVAYGFTINTIYYTMYAGYAIRITLQRQPLELDAICEIVTVHGVTLRYILLLMGRRDISRLIADCRALWKSFVRSAEDVAAIRSFERKAYTFGRLFYCVSFSTITAYILSAQFVRIPSLEPNGTALRILPFKFYVDVQEEPWYALATLLQAVVTYSITVSVTCIESVIPFLTMMACGYLRTISERLIAMGSINEGSGQVDGFTAADRVLVCVRFHQKVLQFCENLDRFTRGLFLVQVMCTLYNMSLIALTILKNEAEAAKYILLLANNVIQFFACQWVSQHLFDQSAAVADAAYCAAFSSRQLNLRTNKMLYMMILRADKPIQLTAIGIVRLSLETFKNMMVNAFSFFTVLRSFAA